MLHAMFSITSLRRAALALALTAGLAACTLSLPGKGPEPAPAAILPGDVQVTTLAAPATTGQPEESHSGYAHGALQHIATGRIFKLLVDDLLKSRAGKNFHFFFG